MKCFLFDLNYTVQIELFNKEHFIPPQKHISRKIQTYILYFVTKGLLHLSSNGEELLLKEGDICLFKPGDTQEALSSNECEYYYVHFNSSAIATLSLTAEEYLQRIEDNEKSFSMSNARGFERYDFFKAFIMKKANLSDKSVIIYLSELFEKSRTRFGESSMEKRLKTCLSFSDILVKIEQFTSESLLNDNDSRFKTYKKINAVRGYIDQNFFKDIDSTEIERRFSFQYDYINRLFRNITGDSIVKYKNKKRIEAAKFLLVTTEKEIEIISEEIGFHDVYYFIRYFKRNVGCTPLQFKEKEKNEIL